MELEFATEGVETTDLYDFAMEEMKPGASPAWVVDWGPMIKAILKDIRAGIPVPRIAATFHNTLVEIIVAVAYRAREDRIVLSGGCFQNRYLTEHAVRRLRDEGFHPYWHQRIPPNDGGIALGQAVVAAYPLRERK